MREFIENEYLIPALSIGVDYNTFWTLSPKTLKPFFDADLRRFKRENDIADLKNWQAGQYYKIALADVVGTAFGKNKVNNYPNKPLFQSDDSKQFTQKKKNELTEKEKENERLKAKLFFSNLGNFVSIKNK